MKANQLSIGWATRQPQPAQAIAQVIDNIKQYGRRQAAALRAGISAHRDAIVAAAGGTLCVAFTLSLIYLSAIIGG